MPFFSTVEGTWLDTTTLDAAYWYRNLHQPVRFSHAIQTLTDDGHRAFIEISPHPTLVPAIEDTTENTTENITATGSLRRGDNDTHRFLTALAHTHTTGIGTPTTWHHHYTQTHPHPHNHHLDLPTYPFQHQHYWLQPPTTTTDLTTTGLTPTHHPLLTATLTLADNNTQLLTGRLSLRTHPWLTDHTVVGTTLVPGTALLELALQATTTDHLEELALHTPLVIPREGAVDVQVHINPPDDTDTRSLTIYSRSENAPAAAPWRHHATAVLGTKTSRIETGRSHDDLSMWPPAGAVRCADEELAALYGDYEANGFVYGPAFRGLTAAWRLGDEVFAEVRLPEQVHGEASAYNLHPALLDAALHAAAFAPSGSLPQGSVPFSFTGVTLHAANASSLRVRLSPADPNSGHAAVSVLVTDDTGTPVASVEALAVRPLAADELRAAERAVQRAELFDMKWVEVPSEGLVSGGASVVVLDGADDLVGLAAEEDGVPGVVVLRCPDAGADGGGGGGGVGEVVGGVLGVVQGWLGLERFAGSRLVVVTRGAVVAGPEDGPVDGPVDVVGAAVWGLVRSAQAEHPDRFVLLDLDTDLDSGADADAGNEAGMGSGLDGGRVAAVVACGEPQLAVRGERVLAARLTRLESPVDVSGREVLPWLSGGSVLVTGGTGVLGAAVARHLAGVCGVRDLLLVSRRGPDAPGAEGLRAELAALGAEVRIVACDVGERREVVRLLEGVPAGCPLTGVVHAAGVLDDATIASLTPERLGTVFAAKVDAALLLDELTRGMELSAFVLFSSAAGILGSAGQGNYAAANAALDALAYRRRAAGLPGVSLAWGLWEEASGMTGHLAGTDHRRIIRSGLHPMSTPDALALFDAALALDRPVLLPADLRPAPPLPPLLQDLLPATRRRTTRTTTTGGADNGAQLHGRLAGQTHEQQHTTLLALVRSHIATVLGHTTPDTIPPTARSATSASTPSPPSNYATGSPTPPDSASPPPSPSTTPTPPPSPTTSTHNSSARDSPPRPSRTPQRHPRGCPRCSRSSSGWRR
ncbi:hypothetical protein SAV31267_088200 [Streptomyces avermitilis]|uniref:PKS/mFAS DH domain-containing protein n=1 Tax=Streptomyces avermitilis TaxID=33903 RepID=A0A4D4N746_STRAX|nr:hypothetical protein SAV31267_088200 [Streptomyces avermitilis]